MYVPNNTKPASGDLRLIYNSKEYSILKQYLHSYIHIFHSCLHNAIRNQCVTVRQFCLNVVLSLERIYATWMFHPYSTGRSTKANWSIGPEMWVKTRDVNEQRTGEMNNCTSIEDDILYSIGISCYLVLNRLFY